MNRCSRHIVLSAAPSKMENAVAATHCLLCSSHPACLHLHPHIKPVTVITVHIILFCLIIMQVSFAVKVEINQQMAFSDQTSLLKSYPMAGMGYEWQSGKAACLIALNSAATSVPPQHEHNDSFVSVVSLIHLTAPLISRLLSKNGHATWMRTVCRLQITLNQIDLSSCQSWWNCFMLPYFSASTFSK